MVEKTRYENRLRCVIWSVTRVPGTTVGTYHKKIKTHSSCEIEQYLYNKKSKYTPAVRSNKMSSKLTFTSCVCYCRSPVLRCVCPHQGHRLATPLSIQRICTVSACVWCIQRGNLSKNMTNRASATRNSSTTDVRRAAGERGTSELQRRWVCDTRAARIQ